MEEILLNAILSIAPDEYSQWTICLNNATKDKEIYSFSTDETRLMEHISWKKNAGGKRNFRSLPRYCLQFYRLDKDNKLNQWLFLGAFENVGTLEAVIRAISCVEWDNGSPMEETLEIGQDWTLKDDGYYYYNKTLKSGETTSVFLSGVTFNNNKKQGTYKIPIYVESAQVKNGVYKELFYVGGEYE